MARIPRQMAQVGLETGGVVQFPNQSPIGGAISRAGNDLRDAGEKAIRVNEQMEEFKADRDYDRFVKQRQIDLDKLEAEAEPGASGLTDRALETWNTSGREFLGSLPPRLQERYRIELETGASGYEHVAGQREVKLGRDWYRTELEGALTDLQKIVGQGDPNDAAALEGLRAEGERKIRSTGLEKWEKAEIIAKWNSTAADAAAMSLLQKDPAALKAALGIDAPDEDIGSTLEAALIGEESTGNAAIVNPWGYAGLYQFGAPRLAALGIYTPGRGEDLKGWSKSKKDVAGKWSGSFDIPGHPGVRTLADFLASPEAQRAAFKAHDQMMDREIDERGLENYIGETVGGIKITRDGIKAMMHLGGPGGARRALRGESVPDANQTEVLSYAKLGLPGAVPTGDRADPRFQDIPIERRYQLYNIAKAREDEVNAVERVTVAGLVADDVASMTTTGTGVGGLDAQRVTDALGEQRALQWADDRIAAQSRFQAIDGMPSLTDEELSGRLDAVRPEPGAQGYDAAIDTYDAAEAEVKRVRDERARDPAKSVGTLPEVRRAIEAQDKSTPEARARSNINVIRARISAQERIGISPALQLPLTKDEARQFAAPIKAAAAINAEGEIGDWFGIVDQLAAALKESYGEYQDEAFRQVMMQLVGQDEDKARHASSIIRGMLEDQMPFEDVRAFDTATETARTESVAKQFSGSTDPAYTTTMAGRRPASSRLTPGTKPSAQSALPKVSEAERRALSKPTLNMPEPDDGDLQYLKDNHDTLEDFVSIFGEDAVPEELR